MPGLGLGEGLGLGLGLGLGEGLELGLGPGLGPGLGEGGGEWVYISFADRYLLCGYVCGLVGWTDGRTDSFLNAK